MSIEATRPNIPLKILGQPVSSFREVELDGFTRLQAVPPALPPFDTRASSFDHGLNLLENRNLEYRAFAICSVETMASIEILQRKASEGDIDAARILMHKVRHVIGDQSRTRLGSTVEFFSRLDFGNLLAQVQPQQMDELSELIQDTYFYFRNHNGVELLISSLKGPLTNHQLHKIHALSESILQYTFVSDDDKLRLIQALQARRGHC